MRLFLWLALAVAALTVLDRALLALERWGLIYYRRKKPSPGALGSALAQVHGILEPEKRHVAEVQRAEPLEQKERGAGASGDPNFIVRK